jgi:hypothetical protein
MKRCLFCGCTDRQACVERASGETCEWLGDEWLSIAVCSFCYLLHPIARFIVDAEAAHQVGLRVPRFSAAERDRARVTYETYVRGRRLSVAASAGRL